MSSPTGVLDLPQRLTLSAQAATALRKAITEGLWRDFLPSERRLCDLLQVSRPTVRSALKSLATEGWIQISQGRKIQLRPPPTARPVLARRLVALISHQPISRLTLTAFQGISEMRSQLARHGYATEEFVCRGRGPRVQLRQLEAYVRESRILGCVLPSVSREIQQWLAAHAVPALVLGSCHDQVRLPSLDVDYRAVCRHAAGVFLRQGHRRLAFVGPDWNVAGDLVSEEGFQEGTVGRPGVKTTLLRHTGTPVDLAAKLSALFKSPSPPTALLVARPAHTLLVLLYLLRHGIRVPDDVSVIARDHDPLYESALDHYAFDATTFAHRLSRLVLQLVGAGQLRAEPHLIFPRYVALNTVRAIRG